MACSGYLLEDPLTDCGPEFGKAEIAQSAVQAVPPDRLDINRNDIDDTP
jgi:hypothetical protein